MADQLFGSFRDFVEYLHSLAITGPTRTTAHEIFDWGLDEAQNLRWDAPTSIAPRFITDNFGEPCIFEGCDCRGIAESSNFVDHEIAATRATFQAIRGIPWGDPDSARDTACLAVGHELDQEGDYCNRCRVWFD